MTNEKMLNFVRDQGIVDQNHKKIPFHTHKDGYNHQKDRHALAGLLSWLECHPEHQQKAAGSIPSWGLMATARIHVFPSFPLPSSSLKLMSISWDEDLKNNNKCW